MCSELHLQAFVDTPTHVHVQFNLQQFKMLSLPHLLCYLSQPSVRSSCHGADSRLEHLLVQVLLLQFKGYRVTRNPVSLMTYPVLWAGMWLRNMFCSFHCFGGFAGVGRLDAAQLLLLQVGQPSSQAQSEVAWGVVWLNSSPWGLGRTHVLFPIILWVTLHRVCYFLIKSEFISLPSWIRFLLG